MAALTRTPKVEPRKVVVLGSTGSIGVSTLDLFEQAEVGVEILALTAGRNVAKLAEQALRWKPQVAVIDDETCLPELRERLAGSGVRAAAGAAAVSEAAAMGADWVMSAIVGAAGLAPTLAAARTGAVIALANKESLVCAGPALLAIARQAGGSVIPVDSEHSAIFQVLQRDCIDQVSRLILTASGGPFRTWDKAAMAKATPEQAVAHPNWSMGAKISVDSATMMNKGLEMIEASYLFDTPQERIDVVIHPQSVIHSLVEYADGSTLAQLGPPDMRSPISCAFAWPQRLSWPAKPLDLAAYGQLTFEAPDLDRFPSIAIAREALRLGGGAPAAMNAANEVAVAAFLDRQIGFLDIAGAVAGTLERMNGLGELADSHGDALDSAMMTDASARRIAAEVVGQKRT
ncbi:1-deoxy-D-xylulose-5-phosphate reductoisomerase [Caulobacter sp. BK020]|uniref:1-deoxy-D-xylulose-5-phosphate reductoisomerase n=1 Tax=Caulobacter sp. BK020 TaxID=2512117 RepID=UPI001052C7DD|nr:1-deoxy-D-xylulose-5-phosphate reductoisomerase [Caulobacter sp. BK020]TCS17389.1 1-deoxy-D-xylulose 5-phosphate reductoisomerase [Caulobacter sp. BK020]